MVFSKYIIRDSNLSWFFSFLYIFLTFSIGTQGQEIKEFSESYTLENDLTGEALFSYYTSGRDTIKQGPFYFQHSETDSVGSSQIIKSIILSGEYIKNVKNGIWSYSFKEFEPEGRPVTTENEIVFNATGRDYTTRTFFKEGKVHGNYEIQDRTIVNSVTTDTLFFLNASYEEGVMQEVIEGKTDSVKVSGSLNEKGMPQGKWELIHHMTSGDLVEIREFDEGVLSSHYFIHNNNTYPVRNVGMDQYGDGGEENWEEVVAGPEYFRLISYASVGLKGAENDVESLANPLLLVQAGNTLLEKVFYQLDVHENRKIWELSEGGAGIQPVLVKVRKYPLSDEESKFYSEAVNLLEATQSTIENYLEDPYVNIGLHTYQDIHFYYEVMAIFRERVKILAPLINLLSDDATEFLNRDALIKEIFPEIIYPQEVEFEFDDTIISEEFPFPQGISQNNGSLREIHTHLGEIFKNVTEISENSENILEEYKAQSELPEKEAQLLSRKDSIVNLFTDTTQKEEYNKWHSTISQSVQNFAENLFKEYAALPVTEKVTRIDEVFNCYDDLFELYVELEDLPRKLDRINEVYTRTTWNPYTFTYMDERVKENVYEAFELEIFPFMWEELSHKISCGEIRDKTKNLEILYRKMVTLRDEDTKQIERQLRRSNTLEEILTVLNLELY
jgi:hypothetical protein